MNKKWIIKWLDYRVNCVNLRKKHKKFIFGGLDWIFGHQFELMDLSIDRVSSINLYIRAETEEDRKAIFFSIAELVNCPVEYGFPYSNGFTKGPLKGIDEKEVHPYSFNYKGVWFFSIFDSVTDVAD